MAGGIVLIIFAIALVAQVTRGQALQRLQVLS